MKEQLDLAKGLFDLCKQILVAVILVFLVFYPAAIGGALDRMGVTEGDIWGLKWKKEFKNTDEALQKSEASVVSLTEQLKLANQTIKEQSELIATLPINPAAGPSDPQQRPAVIEAAKKVFDQNQSAITATQQSSQAIQQTIAANSQLVARTQASDAQTPSRWVILTGSDPNEAAAMDELRRAQRAGFSDVKLIRNRGVYRSGILYSDRVAAAAALDVAKAKTRPDAYIVSMEKWCPNARDVRPDLIECGS